jgi:DNA-binding beta-propeller fold protein YncE
MIPGDIPFRAGQEESREALSEFPEALHWVNRRGPVRLFDLRGRIVLVVFWNASSASSENLINELRQMQRKHPDEFVLLGVHTPRYPAQQPDAVLLKALQRVRFQGAVANDQDWLAWMMYSVPAWPTTLLVDPDGRLAARFVGEGRIAEIEDAMTQLQDGLPPLRAHPSTDPLERTLAVAAGPLAFPAHALATDSRLFVSDTGHHRILECSHDGRVLRQFGSGTPGNWDGQSAACGFQSPQGLALGQDVLYVADSGNHCVRRVMLDTGEVDTVLGAGRPAYGDVEAQGSGLRVAINAPHALAVDGDELFVAATGQNQILRVDLGAQRAMTLAGDGRSDVRDGIGGQASLCQPGALALMPGQLLVADSGGNAIRRLRFADLALTTLAGSSPWEPGRLDGTGRKARLAYPCGLATTGSRVFVADTCNDRLCVLDPYSGELATLQCDCPLHEPRGLSFAAESLWVADCDDHAILRIDPERGTCARVAVDG